MEVVEDGGGRLSVILAGHPKLRNDLRRPTMEEIGYRTEIITLDGIGSQREYIQWLLMACSEQQDGDTPVLTWEAIDILATKITYSPAGTAAYHPGTGSGLSYPRAPHHR